MFCEMKQAGVAVVVLLSAGFLSAVPQSGATSVGETCDFSGLDLEDMVQTLVGRLPSTYTPPNGKAEEIVSGLFVEPTVYKNMDKLHPITPVVGFCRDGLKLVQVDLANSNAPLHVVIPWRTCGGKNGTLETYNQARVTVTLKVADPGADVTNQTLNESPMVHHGIPVAVDVQVGAVALRGAGEVLGTVVSVLGRLLFQGIARELGDEMVTYKLRDVVNEVGRS